MSRIRPFRPGDEPALAEICLRTADAGGDATGVLDDDAIWAHIWVLPYVERHPELAFVVEDDEGRVAGYVVATDDTDAFEAWFGREWWPRHAHRWPMPDRERTRQDGALRYAYGRGSQPEPHAAAFPAHLHIDLLPGVQGRGWGRLLMDEVAGALRDRGAVGVHLVASMQNTGALAFYTRLGFAPLPSGHGAQAFGRHL